ncbi:MAG: hypothetical protein AB1696_23445 [Planctomycetota bacterium]
MPPLTKMLTIRIDDPLYKWLKKYCVENRTHYGTLIKGMLVQLMKEDEREKRANK